jgi:hypothetical protein
MLKILILPVKQKNFSTKIFLSFKLISWNSFILKSFQQVDLNSNEGGKIFWPEPKEHTEHFCCRK